MEKFYFSRFTFSVRCKTTLFLPSYAGSISYFHCGYRLDDTGFKDLIRQAKEIETVKRALYWHDWERYSNRQNTRMKMGGFMGEITYEGELGEFWPYIKLGEYVHVGKGSGFGLGRYRIEKA